MKKNGLMIMILLITMGLSGCQFEPPTPESLIQPPASNEEKVKQKQIITSLLNHSENLTVPSNMDDPSAFVSIDLDDDQVDEMLAFYVNRDKSFQLGFVILVNNHDEWRISHKAQSFGTEVDCFELVDLDGDGNKEILFGVNTGMNKELHIYQLYNDQLKELGQIKYDQYTVARFSDHQSNSVVAVTSDLNEIPAKSELMVYQVQDEQVVLSQQELFNGCCKDVIFAKVGDQLEGIYLTMEHMYQLTSIMLWAHQDERLVFAVEEALPFDYEAIAKMTLFKDANNDGTIEFCTIDSPIENFEGKNHNDYIKVWKQWDGLQSFISIQAALTNVNDGFEFAIPVAWLDQLDYYFSKENNIDWINFGYEDDDFQWVDVFSIAAVDQTTWDQSQSADQWIKLGNHPKKNKVYIARVNADNMAKMDIEISQLIACVKIDGGK